MIVNAIAFLHDLLVSTYQGYIISKDKPIDIRGYFGGTSKDIKKLNLDIESIKHYSQRLETLVYTTSY